MFMVFLLARFHPYLRANPSTAGLTAADVSAFCSDPDGALLCVFHIQ